MDLSEYFFIWLINSIIFGIISSIISYMKGHSAWSGFFYGLSLGIFGLLIVSFGREPEKKTLRKRVASGEMKMCTCGSVVLTAVPICPVCKRDISRLQPDLSEFDRVQKYKDKQRKMKLLGVLVPFGIMIGMIFLQPLFLSLRLEMNRQKRQDYGQTIVNKDLQFSTAYTYHCPSKKQGSFLLLSFRNTGNKNIVADISVTGRGQAINRYNKIMVINSWNDKTCKPANTYQTYSNFIISPGEMKNIELKSDGNIYNSLVLSLKISGNDGTNYFDNLGFVEIKNRSLMVSKTIMVN